MGSLEELDLSESGEAGYYGEDVFTAEGMAALGAWPGMKGIRKLDLSGHDTAGSIADIQRCCGGRILVLTASGDIDVHRAAVMKGARGVLHKAEPATTIVRAIEKVHAGEVWLNRALMGEVLGRLTGHAPAPAHADGHQRRIGSLTPREREIVAAIVNMAGAKQLAMACQMSMSEHTLRNHLTAIYAKLAVRGRLELHLYALEHGLSHAPHGKAA